MKILITGGSCSGKSEEGERLTCRVARGKLYYFATMRIFSKEDEARVVRHRRQRNGKGYNTIEAPVHILGKAARDKKGTALVDCIGNLWANENYENGKTAQNVADELYALSGYYQNIVWVTNDVFLSGEFYGETTLEYMRGLGYINQFIAQRSDIVIEMCCGIPIFIKGEALYHEIT